MKRAIRNYHKSFLNLIEAVRVTGNHSKKIDFEQGIENTCKTVKKCSSVAGSVFFIGNGGSSAIANHMAIDFWKNAKIKSLSFSDSALLTCISNDFGYEHVYAKPINFFAGPKDVLFAISSSGRSKNILNGVTAAKSKQARIITLSGFDSNNPLRAMGICNFYVPSCEYGLVEIVHQYICHCIVDMLIRIE